MNKINDQKYNMFPILIIAVILCSLSLLSIVVYLVIFGLATTKKEKFSDISRVKNQLTKRPYKEYNERPRRRIK
jgi:cell shape-determining protein MreC